MRGLSPRMRGNRARKHPFHVGVRSIPAHAGQPLTNDATVSGNTVYPRACGATPRTLSRIEVANGLSPRMRGNPVGVVHGRGGIGSIPAHAGQPLDISLRMTSRRVYPRACGATEHINVVRRVVEGLSPRMRGNRHLSSRFSQHLGSIPAHAGQPSGLRSSKSIMRVYPRACGATS